MPKGGGGGYSDISYIGRLTPLFGDQNFEFQYFWGVSEKMNIFEGMKILWIFLGGHHKIGLYLGVISMFFRSRYRMGNIFGGAKISNIFLGCLKFLTFFW